ncbi:hypothetical protein BBP40_004048 [Aspergillus hancockii]|nr:hypothetical protein BBP40_004048 [Aspergillus hancockii]
MTWFGLFRCLGRWRGSDDLTPFSGKLPPFEARIDATTFVRYVNGENFTVENGTTTVETSRIGHQGNRGADQNMEESKDLTNERGPSIMRASNLPDDHPVAMQRIRTPTPRDSGGISVLPEPGLSKTLQKQACRTFPMLNESTRDQIELLGYAGVLDSPVQESIMLLGVKYREEPKIMGCTVSFFNREEQETLRRELAYYLTKDEWFHVRRYGFYWH